MIKIDNKKKINFWMYFYIFSIMLGLFILVISCLFYVNSIYLYSIRLTIFILIVFASFLFLNLRYIEMENSEMVLSIKEYHPMGGRFFPQFYRQVEIPITEIHSIKIELITKKFLIFIESKTIGKIITRTFVLQYMDEECLRKMDESLKGSI